MHLGSFIIDVDSSLRIIAKVPLYLWFGFQRLNVYRRIAALIGVQRSANAQLHR